MSFFVTARSIPGRSAIARRGLWSAHKWLLWRRLTQAAIIGLFLAGPLAGVWVLKGSLASSVLLGTVPLSDPFLLLQSLAAGHRPLNTALLGGLIVALFYLLVGGRSYCAWVCPVNLLTDGAGWLRRRLGLKTGKTPAKSLRLWLLASVLVAAAVSGSMVWEALNPVTLSQRLLIFGGASAGLAALAVFVYDLVVAPRGWCGHVCPQGAAYGLLGKRSLIRVAAVRREACDDCLDCFAVCPEPQVIRPALKGDGSRLITASDCSNCGRCIDVCPESVFAFALRNTHRFEPRRDAK